MAKTVEALRRAEIEQEQRAREAVTLARGNGQEKIGASFAAEEYRRMKQKILSSDSGHPDKNLVFCSTAAGEGNSTVLIGFANTLASGGERVLLVDANLQTPSLHRSFNLRQENGFSDLALPGAQLDGVIKKTALPNRFVITSGATLANPCSVFESPLLTLHIQQMKKRADWVLFDAAPVNSCPDAMLLAGKTGGVIMVIQAGKTRWEVAQEAIDQLKNGGAKVIGAFLNRREYPIPAWLYKRI